MIHIYSCFNHKDKFSLQGSLLMYLRKLKDLFVPLWQADAPVAGDLESMFRISWGDLTEFAKQAAQGMAFLEENKVFIYLFLFLKSFTMCQYKYFQNDLHTDRRMILIGA